MIHKESLYKDLQDYDMIWDIIQPVELSHEFYVRHLAFVDHIVTLFFPQHFHSSLVVPLKLVAYIINSLDYLHKFFVSLYDFPSLGCYQFDMHGIRALFPQYPKSILSVLFVLFLSLGK